jgi:hypothetical protein
MDKLTIADIRRLKQQKFSKEVKATSKSRRAIVPGNKFNKLNLTVSRDFQSFLSKSWWVFKWSFMQGSAFAARSAGGGKSSQSCAAKTGPF